MRSRGSAGCCVDGEPQAVPLGGEALGLIALLEGVAPGVHRREDDAVFAGEQVVILQFEPETPALSTLVNPSTEARNSPCGYQRFES